MSKRVKAMIIPLLLIMVLLPGNVFAQVAMMNDPLAAGDAHSLFLVNDGTLHSSGYNSEGQLGDASMTDSNAPVTVDMSGVLAGKTVTSVASGESFSAALTTDGAIYTWGRNTHGQLGNGTNISSTVPVAVDMTGALSGKTMVAITAGTYHIVALASDGTVYTWGHNTEGELGNGSTTSSNVPVAVDMTGVLAGKVVTALAAGSAHSLVLASDGSMYSWGYNNFGQLGNGSTSQSLVPVAVDMTGVLAGKTVTSMTAVYVHNLVLCSDGTVHGWGANVVGELGDGSGVSQSSPVSTYMGGSLAGKTVTALTSGLIHTLALASDGNLYAWGDGADGRLGNGSTTGSFTPIAVTMDGALAGKTLTDIDAGWHHNIARADDGSLYAWGSNYWGQFGNGSNTSSNVPVAVNTIELGPYAQTITILGAYGNTGDTDPYIQALPEGATEWSQAYLIGPHPWGQVAGTNSWLNYDPDNTVGTNTSTPYRIRFIVPEDYTDPSMVFQVKADNLGIIWINDTYIDSVVGEGTPDVPDAMIEQALHTGLNEIRITMVDWGSIVGLNYRIDVTMTSAEDISDAVLTPEDAAILNNAPVADAGSDQSILSSQATLDGSGSIDEDGNLLTYSWSESGVEIATGVNPTITVAAGSHTITLTVSDGELTATDDVIVTSTPISAIDDPLAAGDGHSLFRANDGSLYSWGLNGEGQLGNASLTSDNFPVSVDMSGVLAGKTFAGVVSGEAFSVALTTDGGVYGWGRNAHGQLGNGTTVSSSVPVAVDMTGALSGKTVVALTAGTYHVLALASDGTVYGWGHNTEGELGNNSTTSSNVPVAVDMTGVLSGKAVMAMAAGSGHSVVLANDGNMYSWGQNNYGQLGNNSTSQSNVPVAVVMDGVLAGKTVTSMTAVYVHNLVLCDDGTVYGWGANGVGELGDGSGVTKHVPVASYMGGALAGKTVTALTSGLIHTLALASDGNLYAWGDNNNGQLGTGSFNTGSFVPVAVTMDGVLAGKTLTDIDAGWFHSIARDSDGNVFTWGKNEFGQLGNASYTSSNVPVAVTFIEPPAAATTPVPMDEATNVALDQDLSWMASEGASGYLISLGTDNPPTSIVSNYGVITTSYSPASLDYGTTYYWSAKAYNLAGDASGVQVWSFTTMADPLPAAAMNPNPADDATGVALDHHVSWAESATATGYLLSIGTSAGVTDIFTEFNLVMGVDATVSAGVVTFTHAPTWHAYSTEYFWTVVPFNSNGNATGSVQWSYTTMADPIPDVQVTLTLGDGSDEVPPWGGWIYYNVQVSNNTAEQQQVRARITGVGPDGHIYGHLSITPINLRLDPEEMISAELSQYVPGRLMAGMYELNCQVYGNPAGRIDSAGVNVWKFEDVAMGGSGPSDGSIDRMDWITLYTETGAEALGSDVWTSTGFFREDGTEITAALAVGEKLVPEEYSLQQNYPNPFNPSTTISFALQTPGEVSLKVYDIQGAQVSQLAAGHHEAGYYSVQFNPENVSSGTYIYVLEAGSFREVKRMVFLK